MTSSISELRPQVLYRVDGEQARFATWGLTDGHEALAIFTGAEAAEKYRGDLAEPAAWTIGFGSLWVTAGREVQRYDLSLLP